MEKSVDDILGQCLGFKELAEALHTVLCRAIEKGFKFLTEKFRIKNCLKFGGFVVSADCQGVVTIEPVPAHIKAMHDMKQPTTKKEAQSFLGFLNCLKPWL